MTDTSRIVRILLTICRILWTALSLNDDVWVACVDRVSPCPHGHNMDSAAAGRGRGGEVARGLMFNEAAADWEIGCRPPRLLMSPPPPPPTHPHCTLGGGY